VPFQCRIICIVSAPLISLNAIWLMSLCLHLMRLVSLLISLLC
jgi:hypothetical protein